MEEENHLRKKESIKHTQTNNNGHLSTTASLNLDKLIFIPILFIKRPKSDQLCASTKGGGHYKQV
jgi:hypothetical protein